MATAIQQQVRKTVQEKALRPAVVLMAIAVMVSVVAVLLSSDIAENFPYLFLLPWIIALAVVLAIPTLILYYKGRLTLYDPLMYATWSYFFPAFVVGGFMLTAGWSDPYYLTFIQDARYNLPYTTVLIMLGYAGLAAGYFLPLGAKLGSVVSRRLPTRDFDSSSLFLPGLFLLVLGTLNTLAALAMGVIGYQRSEIVESYTGILFLTTLFWMQGTFVLWFAIFKRGKLDVRAIVLLVLLLIGTFANALFAGNRAGLLQVFIIVILAFLLAGGRMTFRRTAVAGVLLGVSLAAGMIYGTTFRHVKGSESQVTLEEYTSNIFQTFEQVGRFDLSSTSNLVLMGLAARLDTLSQVGVVVSNYEQLAPYEESYGLDNNIWKDLTTFFVPRVLWHEKPVSSEPRKYSDLYFDYGENSFAITPIGDLLRNYGPFGVPIGMFFFGIIIRFIYRSLIEDQPKLFWRITLYFMLLMTISYEGFYGLLIPLLFKVGITAIVGLLIIGLVGRALGYQRKEQTVLSIPDPV